jgi:hypothetical protein
MSKKNFTGGLNSLLGDQPKTPKVGRPKTSTRKLNSSSQEGTKENETRATFIINEEILDKLKAIAYWDRKLIKEVVNTALQEYLDKKKPNPRPEEVRIKDQEATQKQITTEGYKARLPKY